MKKIFMIMAILLLATVPAKAAGLFRNTICGQLNSDGHILAPLSISNPDELYELECLVGTNRANTRSQELEAEYWNGRWGACLEYDGQANLINTLTSLTNCTITNYTCRYDEYYTDSTCEPCENGNHAGGADGHTSTKCNYCYNEHYYYSEIDDDCHQCPNNGYANDVKSPITDCYIIQNKTGTDITGTYEVSDTRCYWME